MFDRKSSTVSVDCFFSDNDFLCSGIPTLYSGPTLYPRLQRPEKRFYVPQSEVGRLVGRSFPTREFLEENTECKIFVSPQPLTTREHVTGKTQGAVDLATDWIKHIVYHKQREVTYDIDIVEERRVPIPDGKIGLLIGRNGETIKKFRRTYRAQIKLVKINGAQEAVVVAGKSVIDECVTELNTLINGGADFSGQ